MWGIPVPDLLEMANENVAPELERNRYYRTMFDVELVLRFFAHRQRRRLGSGALRIYLDRYLKEEISSTAKFWSRWSACLMRPYSSSTTCWARKLFGCGDSDMAIGAG